MSLGDIGLIGLAVMGQNLIMNMNDHGFTVVAFNRTTSKVDDFLKGPAKGSKVIGTHTIQEFVSKLKRPRKIMLMVKAGVAVDDLIAELLPYLEKGDILIDGGNSLFTDTERRVKELSAKGILFLGCGISGGEEGARHGPSIMPGGNPEAWPAVKPIFQAIAAKADGEPCCDWVGSGGAGHYVKMVHNGIEYGDMQLISEAYDLLHNGIGIQNAELHDIFVKWNKTELDSYLIEITSDIFAYKDKDGQPLLDKILDVAAQKGTGKWTVIDALDQGSPLTLIAQAVFSRYLSALKDERVAASKELKGPSTKPTIQKEAFIEAIRKGLYAAKIISYTQGFMLMRSASEAYKWNLNFGAVALMWRGGCIIRSVFLGEIKKAFTKNPNLKNLLLDPFFKNVITDNQAALREVIAQAAYLGIATPCHSAGLNFYDSYRRANLPANLVQAQRDYFGAHTYERIDSPRGTYFHTEWTSS